ncbi:efflux RND transporter periplasmic adaptor subunit [Alteromonas sp. KUL49]|uniref:efflux RND transporter periplasmic adaptor subunit n=1 Tax=Alteromonas sp. KUL49 TaxID=2480798 RepID=UPI00102EEB72|nr:efflux RND transporter periplasmic adaptor subunit [Alteromonas sp. KUL49]TAP34497.1 efflux RND transporter periplasmic adaptor subunit [Alteromonas sp. KUL49]GEA13547.1 hypothetical protein KUL49_39220 [Alteromonas sp. KUL49]
MGSSADDKSENTPVNVYEKPAPWLIHGLVTLALLVIAFLVVSALFGSKPSANRWGDRPAPSVAVETTPLSTQSYSVWVDSYGTAEALTQSLLVSEINGRVVSVSPNIRTGASFRKGEVLVELDDRDYQVEVDVAASAAAEAELAYLQEVAQAEFASQEWNQRPTSEAARKLALREPQLAATKAAWQAAKSRLTRAITDLERTKIIAPFDGRVLSQTVDVGQVVSPGQGIADIYDTDVVEVRLPIKIHDLEHLSLPESQSEADNGPMVVLESDMGSRTYQWNARIVRTEGAFDPATRMLYAVAQVEAPFVSTNERPAIRIGQFVRAKVAGHRYDDVFVIPRRAVSQDFFVSIAQEGILQKVQVSPLWTDSEVVVVANSLISNDDMLTGINSELSVLSPSDALILTPTANLPNGTRVRSMEDIVPSENRRRPSNAVGSAGVERGDSVGNNNGTAE